MLTHKNALLQGQGLCFFWLVMSPSSYYTTPFHEAMDKQHIKWMNVTVELRTESHKIVSNKGASHTKINYLDTG